jgi:hypothetical protein
MATRYETATYRYAWICLEVLAGYAEPDEACTKSYAKAWLKDLAGNVDVVAARSDFAAAVATHNGV